jgi:hypothetical protein
VGSSDFAEYLRGRGLDPEAIARSLAAVRAFDDWLHAMRGGLAVAQVSADDTADYVFGLAEKKDLTNDDLLALARYVRFVGNHRAFIALVELYGAPEVPVNLAGKLAELAGDDVREAVFAGLDVPPTGSRPSVRPAFTRELMERLERHVDPVVCEQAMTSNLHYVPRETFAEERARFLELGDVDEFIHDHHERFIRQLEDLRDRGQLYFEQPVTDDVIEYVRATPTCTPGVREGSVVRQTKIPYQADEYLHERDEVRRRYLACHCPWVRESLLDPEVAVSPRFCQCSAGFEKQMWDAVLDEPVRADVVRSVLGGDEICEFAVHLPAWVIPTSGPEAPA